MAGFFRGVGTGFASLAGVVQGALIEDAASEEMREKAARDAEEAAAARTDSEREGAIYKEMLVDLQCQQMQLCRNFEQQLVELQQKLDAQGGAAPPDPPAEDVDAGSDPAAVIRRLRYEKELLEETNSGWEAKLRSVMTEQAEARVRVKVLEHELSELQSEKSAIQLSLDMHRSELSEVRANAGAPTQGSSVEDQATIENLVAEYSKLSNESEEQTQAMLKKQEEDARIISSLRTQNEELQLKLKMHEQNILTMLSSGDAEMLRNTLDRVSELERLLSAATEETERVRTEAAAAAAAASTATSASQPSQASNGTSSGDVGAELDRLRRENASLQQRLSSTAGWGGEVDFRSEFNKVSAQLEEATSALRARDAQIASLRRGSSSGPGAGAGSRGGADELDAARATSAKAQADAEEAQRELAEVRNRLTELEAALQTSEAALADERTTKAALEERTRELSTGLENLRGDTSQVDELRLSLEAAQQAAKTAQDELAAARAQVTEAEARVAATQQAAGASATEAAAKAQADANDRITTAVAEAVAEAVAAEKEASSRALEEERQRAAKAVADASASGDSATAAAVAAAQAAAEEAQQRALEAAAAQAAQERQQALEAAEAKHTSTVAEVKSSMEQRAAEALAQAQAAAEAEKQQALDEVAAEHAKVVARMEDDMAAQAKEHAARLAAEEEKLAAVQAELANVAETYEKRQAEAVADAEAKAAVRQEEALAELQQQMDAKVARVEAERDEFQELYSVENRKRKEVHNKLMDLQGNIRVYCRVRPVLDVERRSGEDVEVCEFPTPEDLIVRRDDTTMSRFEYDRVFSPTSTQEEVFSGVAELIVSCMDGYNVCIFAYGQTGSGKTFTMEGDENNRGVNYRAFGRLFSLAEERANTVEYTFTLSMLEIYNETVRDLLDEPPARGQQPRRLDVRGGPQGVVVPGLTERPVSCSEDVIALMAIGAQNRVVGAHDMNLHSSRSHSVLSVNVQGTNLRTGEGMRGKLHLIDLAGSERVSKTDASGDRLKEAQNINRSLSALGDVVAALGQKGGRKGHVPYRNSKLTFLLSDSLGGNSKVAMFVNISPVTYNVSESLCSLTFASRCRATELGQARRQTENPDVGRYRRLADRLAAELQAAGGDPEPILAAAASEGSGGGGSERNGRRSRK